MSIIFCFLLTYIDVPSVPGKPEADIKSKTEIELKWSPPESDGGSMVTGYTVEKYDLSHGEWFGVNDEQVCFQVDVISL